MAITFSQAVETNLRAQKREHSSIYPVYAENTYRTLMEKIIRITNGTLPVQELTVEEKIILAAGAYTHMGVRDSLILLGMNTASSDEVMSLIITPQASLSHNVVTRALTRVMEDTNATIDQSRLLYLLDIANDVLDVIPDEACAPFYTIQAYANWILGRMHQTEILATKALQISPNYGMADILMTCVNHDIRPAYLR